MKKVVVIVLIVLLFVILIGTRKETEVLQPQNPPNSAEGAPPGSIHNLPIPEGVRAARVALSTRLTIPESQILILEAIETDWPDACLGIKEKDTMCAQVITPGYNVLMQAGGTEYRYRTNLSGTIVKAEK